MQAAKENWSFDLTPNAGELEGEDCFQQKWAQSARWPRYNNAGSGKDWGVRELYS